MGGRTRAAFCASRAVSEGPGFSQANSAPPLRADPNAQPDRAVVVVRVHESEETPHAVDGRTVIYLRTDNVSCRFLRKAALGDIEWLVNKRQKSAIERSRILQLVESHAAVYRERRRRSPAETMRALLWKGQFAFYTTPRYPRAPLAEPWHLGEVLTKSCVQLLCADPGYSFCSSFRRSTAVAEGVYIQDSYGTSELQQQGMLYQIVDFFFEGEFALDNSPFLIYVVCVCYLIDNIFQAPNRRTDRAL
jgi:hypothetical protein